MSSNLITLPNDVADLDSISLQIQQHLYRINGRGYLVLDNVIPNFDRTCSDQVVDRLTALSRCLGYPLKAVDALPLWQPVAVNLETEPFRAGGIGYNPFHIDLVNTEFPPDLTALFCVRDDPHEGGVNFVSNLQTAVSQLSEADRKILRQPIFREGQFYGLSHVGGELNPFSVLNPQQHHWQVRFSGKMIPSMPDGAEQQALQRLESRLIQNQEAVSLQPGQLLVMNQRLIAHAREPLGANQAQLSEDHRRLILQLFLRFKFPFAIA